ncbi:MAG TPA: glycine betaine ABC transporter substrate-binding protein [Burkholderiales bacterium]|nr:glycine betaine ABC transporter substrate-binding protein [Burkholderiales bacterium]
MRLSRLAAAALAFACGAAAAETLMVGSKRFTESYILGEIVAQTARAAGARVEHRPGMGGTAILFQALSAGAIDVYPEYTGTIAREILKSETALDLRALNERLAALGLAASVPLGFNNTYAVGVRRTEAERRGLRRISDLARHRDLVLGFGPEFLGRRDGWPGLARAYRLPKLAPRSLDHGLAYEALAAGEVDVIDVYSTDGKIERFDIALLEDNLGFFPAYDAVLLHRADLPRRFPSAFAALAALEGSIDEARMTRLNARAELDGRSFAAVAAEFIGGRSGGAAQRRSLWKAMFAPDFARLLGEHVALVFASLAAAAAVGVPLGIAAAKLRGLAQPVLAATGIVQTIPALALLAFLIPLTGSIGVWPALIALFLYALLPITRNTHAGLVQVPSGLVHAGVALGLRRGQVLSRIELPLAMRTILAGVKTSAVINVGTATIAAFIGAGGFGERIVQGLALNDHTVLLAGALPAAALALAVHALFEIVERSLERPR